MAGSPEFRVYGSNLCFGVDGSGGRLFEARPIWLLSFRDALNFASINFRCIVNSNSSI